ncbi:hypothetical protein LC040_05910 [Bacillus tianshenii]|nr:hypothetical protein LC040_05910 [Bacillus tianshenii]
MMSEKHLSAKEFQELLLKASTLSKQLEETLQQINKFELDVMNLQKASDNDMEVAKQFSVKVKNYLPDSYCKKEGSVIDDLVKAISKSLIETFNTNRL